MIAVVIKPFAGSGRAYAQGDLVDSSDWRNERTMASEGVRQIRPATRKEQAQFHRGVANIFTPQPDQKTKATRRAAVPA